MIDASIADDTCLAFKEYLQHPQDTTIDDLLPCANLASSDVQFLQMRKAMKYVIGETTDQFLFYTNGSTDLTGVCDPIGPAPKFEFTDVCANDTLPVGELSNASRTIFIQSSIAYHFVLLFFSFDY